MVETISPVVHGGRTLRYWVNVGLHALGAVVAAGTVGAALGTIGYLAGAPWHLFGSLLVLAAGALYAARDLFSIRVPLPDLKRQVPEWWRTFFSPPVTSLLYGLGLGLAFFTSLGVGTFVVVAGAALASGDPLLGLLLCAPFGLGRSLAVAAAGTDQLEGGGEQLLIGRANGLVSLLVVLGIAALTFP